MNNPKNAPEKNSFQQGDSLLQNILIVFKVYFKGKAKIAFLLGVISFALLWFLKIPYPIILSITIATFNLIPYVGPIIAGFIVVTTTLIVTGISKALWVLVIIIFIQAIDSWYLEPRILGRTFGMNPLMIFVLVLIGGMVFGIPGMILAVPIAVITRLILKNSR